MNDIHLYVDAFPNRVITLETEKALKKMLSLFQGSSLRITWLYRNQRLSFITILRLVLAERRLCKGRSITINNTIRFEAVKKISPAAICLLSDFNFSVILPENTSDTISNRLLKKQIDLSEQPCLKTADLTSFFDWLKSKPIYKNEIYSSYIRMALGLAPYSCRFRSCLGKTLYIDQSGKPYSCPFKSNRIELNGLEKCAQLQDVFDTNDYAQLIQDAISRREKCSKNCDAYGVCLGGCPLDIGDCPEKDLTKAINAARTHLQENGATDTAVHREICSLLSQQFRV